MRQVRITGGGIVKIHDTICGENELFNATKKNLLEKARKKFAGLDAGDGLCVFRTEANNMIQEMDILRKITQDHKTAWFYFWNKRPEVQGVKKAKELILVKGKPL